MVNRWEVSIPVRYSLCLWVEEEEALEASEESKPEESPLSRPKQAKETSSRALTGSMDLDFKDSDILDTT